MLIRAAVVLSALFAITACSGKGPESTATPAVESPAAAAAAAAAASVAAPAASVVAPAATQVAAAASTTAAATAAPTVAAPATAAAPAAATPTGPAPVLGTDYFIIDTPAVETGKTISVVEVFNYRCPVCAHFQPTISPWVAKLPADIKFSYLPAAFGGPWDDFVLAFYAADVMGVRVRSHDEIFKNFHEENKYTPADIAAVYTKYGVDPKVFVATMESFAVKSKLARARDQITQWGVDGIPTIVVAGKYRVKKTVDDDAFLHNVEWVIAKERAERNQH
jgi:thiol:disulfide interchange protein DsbA